MIESSDISKTEAFILFLKLKRSMDLSSLIRKLKYRRIQSDPNIYLLKYTEGSRYFLVLCRTAEFRISQEVLMSILINKIRNTNDKQYDLEDCDT